VLRTILTGSAKRMPGPLHDEIKAAFKAMSEEHAVANDSATKPAAATEALSVSVMSMSRGGEVHCTSASPITSPTSPASPASLVSKPATRTS